MFTEQVEVTGLQLLPPTAQGGNSQLAVTCRQSSGNQFTITDDAANAANYTIGVSIPHTVGK